MKKIMEYILLLTCLLILSGCWDRQPLKDKGLAMVLGFDLTEDHELKITASIPISEEKKKSSIFLSTVGRTPRDVRVKVDQKTPDNVDPSKNTMVLIGKELANEDIYDILDVFYRNPKSALNARLVISEEKASVIIQKSLRDDKIPSEFLSHLLLNAEQTTSVVKEDLQSTCTLIFDEGKDLTLPLLGLEGSEVEIKGLAMFHGKRMTGKLNQKESAMFLLLRNKLGKKSGFTEQVDPKKDDIASYVSFNVDDIKRKIDINISEDDNIRVKIDLDLKVTITEYPKDHLYEEIVVNELNEKLSKKLTALANTVTKKMQQANCDAFEIGRRLIAFHNTTWKKLDWEKEYPRIKFDTNVTVNIVGNGIVN
ncbi:Ger(x)C family spore germination protein [Wukongibacter sp. M2B1]|uniref:Ger(x)C family spore germination protein n=1 Tax=Wukongibacter sp. M2B1 TaxID=3088895 RepID=UPI003D79B6F6